MRLCLLTFLCFFCSVHCVPHTYLAVFSGTNDLAILPPHVEDSAIGVPFQYFDGAYIYSAAVCLGWLRAQSLRRIVRR